MATVDTPVIDVEVRPARTRDRVRVEDGPGVRQTPAKQAFFKRPGFKYALITHDALILFVSFVLAYTLRGGTVSSFLAVRGMSVLSVALMVVFAGVLPILLKINGLYKIHVFTSVRTQLKFAAKALAYALVLLVVGKLIAIRLGITTADWLGVGVFAGILVSALLASRIGLFRTAFHALATRGYLIRRVLIVGAGPRGKGFAVNLAETPGMGFSVVGFLDDTRDVGSTIFRGASVLGRFADVEKIVEQKKIDEIIICLDNDSVPDLFENIDRCSRTPALVMVSSPAYDIISKNLAQECYGSIPVVGVNNFNRTAYAGVPGMKRIVDTCISVAALLLLSPILIVIMIAIKLESRGPVLYKQTRVGQDGKLFTFYKLRSMTVGADADKSREENYAKLIKGTWNPTTQSNPSKIMNTAAVTRVGKIIRKLSLDEIPQLIHVIKGEMSIVGPRPCIPYEWKHYEPWHRRRFSAMPGCTGLWQVFGRSKVSFHDMVILDVFYSQNVSFHMDMWLMMKTIPVMIFGRGAR